MIELIVFGREPLAGRVKSRLAQAVGPERAASTYRVMLDATIQCATATGLPTRLSLAEPPTTGRRWPLSMEIQRGDDLGSRLLNAMSRGFRRGASAVIIVASDCPEVSADHLRAAARAFDHSRVVIGPACDGGYWLIGVRDRPLDLFSGVPWSKSETYRRTVGRLEKLGVGWCALDRLQDLDTLSDLERLRSRGRTPPALLAAIDRAIGA